MTHLRTLLLFVLGLAAAACSSPDQSPQGQAIPVRTITVAQADIDNVLELPGRVEPVRVAEVRARVTGIVQQRLYEEGTDVGQGQPLFRIDPAELRASYAQTQASLERAKATAANANAVVQKICEAVQQIQVNPGGTVESFKEDVVSAVRSAGSVNA